MGRVVDVHTHVVPPFIPSRGNNAQWPGIQRSGDDAAVTIGGKVFRRIDSRCWDVARRLEDMAADGSDVHVLSPMPELLSHWLPPDDADALADIINTDVMRMVEEAPGRLVGLGMVCMQDATRAVRRLEMLKRNGFRGIEIGSHIAGVPLGHFSLFPIYEALESLGLCLFVHPLHPVGVERIGAAPEYAALAAFPLETALAGVSLLAHGVTIRFPKLRILLSHGGGALPWILPRLDHGRALGGSAAKDFAQPASDLAKSFWYDTILYSDAALAFLGASVGGDRIVVGSDYPFTIRQTEPAAFAARTLGDDAPAFMRNAESLLGLAGMSMLQAAQ